MSKRVNPKRRLLAKQAAALAAVRTEQSVAHAAEMSKLQQGSVRSGLRENPSSMTFRAPRWTSEDNRGKSKPKRRKLFAAN